MSKYSEFQVDGGKTRVQESLESQLADIKNYKNASQNFENLDGINKKDDNFFGLNMFQKDDKNDNTIFRDPRYTTSNTRDDSRRQLNNNKNLKIQSVLPGLESSNNLGSFEETNYENSKFRELTRNLELGGTSSPNVHPLLKGELNNKEINSKGIEPKDTLIIDDDELDMDVNSIIRPPSSKSSKNTESDLMKIINKVKNPKDLKDLKDLRIEDTKPVLRMPAKKISANQVKGRIIQFKNCPEQIQDMIAHALINIWADDFALKKISTHVGVKNFILHNFKDKNNSFFVLFDDEGDFISTFAVDMENFAPMISHLYVNPNLRKRGFGIKTLRYGEKYIKKMGFDTSHLWCEEELIKFYKKNNYNVDSKMKISEDKVVWKMVKNL
jgi:GNAT superfamily N-acetyltransferase